MPPDVVAKHYGPGATDFLAGRRFAPELFSKLIQLAAARGVPGVVDSVGLVVMGNPGRNGMLCLTMARRPIDVTAARRQVLLRLATHLGAGLRLRLSLRQTQKRAEAVLTPGGKVLHAHGDALVPEARAALQLGVRAIEQSRGKLRRSSPTEALAQWRGLVSGRWSIVEWVDTDSRRYLVAHENHVSARDPRALSPRELDVAEFLVQGRSTAEIAWALGLTSGGVSRLSRDVLRKLGAARRTDLPALFGGVAPYRADLPGAKNVVVLTAGASSLWDELTPAELEVVRAVLRGTSVAAIARRRDVSPRTVTTQLAAVYARLGVRGRSELAALLGQPV